MSISFENYRMVHPYDDSDSSGDEVDWQDTRHDPYRAGRTPAGEDKITATRQSAKRRPDASVAELLYTLSQLHHHPFLCVCDVSDKPQTTPRKGFTGKGKNITTKHDEVTCGRKNTARMDNVRWPSSLCLNI